METLNSPKTLPCGRNSTTVKRASPNRGTSVLGEMKKRLDAFVLEKRLNRSETRDKILETIVSESKHFRAQDLLDHLKKKHPEVGKATLYRTLPILIECGIIQEGPTDPEGQVLFELSGSKHHDHIVCLDCKHIFEFHDDSIEKKQNLVSKRIGFTPRDHRHVIYASCDLKRRNK